MKANFVGQCAACRKIIQRDEEIVFSNEAEGWVHQDTCAAVVDREPTTLVCPKCFVHKAISGSCNCYG